MSKVQTDQTFTHVGKNLIDRVVSTSRKHETCRDYNIPWNIPGLRNQPYWPYFNQPYFSTLLKTFCEMEGFAKGSSHENWQRIGKRAWYLCCSVSLSFVDEEVYDVMYRYDVTSYDVTSNDVSVERHSDFELDPRMSPTCTSTSTIFTVRNLQLYSLLSSLLHNTSRKQHAVKPKRGWPRVCVEANFKWKKLIVVVVL